MVWLLVWGCMKSVWNIKLYFIFWKLATWISISLIFLSPCKWSNSKWTMYSTLFHSRQGPQTYAVEVSDGDVTEVLHLGNSSPLHSEYSSARDVCHAPWLAAIYADFTTTRPPVLRTSSCDVWPSQMSPLCNTQRKW